MDYIFMFIGAFLIGAVLMVNHFTNTSEYFCIPSEEVTVDQMRELKEMNSHLVDHTCFRVLEGGKDKFNYNN